MCNIICKFDYCGININCLTSYLNVRRLKLNDLVIMQNVRTAIYIIDPVNLKKNMLKFISHEDMDFQLGDEQFLSCFS